MRQSARHRDRTYLQRDPTEKKREKERIGGFLELSTRPKGFKRENRRMLRVGGFNKGPRAFVWNFRVFFSLLNLIFLYFIIGIVSFLKEGQREGERWCWRRPESYTCASRNFYTTRGFTPLRFFLGLVVGGFLWFSKYKVRALFGPVLHAQRRLVYFETESSKKSFKKINLGGGIFILIRLIK